MLIEKQKQAVEHRLETAEAALASAEAREVGVAEELRKTQEELVDRADENGIMQER